ncbi:MAG TPA: hypothetical protein VF089_13805 [Candidatus Binatia bacterium]
MPEASACSGAILRTPLGSNPVPDPAAMMNFHRLRELRFAALRPVDFSPEVLPAPERLRALARPALTAIPLATRVFHDRGASAAGFGPSMDFVVVGGGSGLASTGHESPSSVDFFLVDSFVAVPAEL